MLHLNCHSEYSLIYLWLRTEPSHVDLSLISPTDRIWKYKNVPCEVDLFQSVLYLEIYISLHFPIKPIKKYFQIWFISVGPETLKWLIKLLKASHQQVQHHSFNTYMYFTFVIYNQQRFERLIACLLRKRQTKERIYGWSFALLYVFWTNWHQ